jgi:hypothetical protein
MPGTFGYMWLIRVGEVVWGFYQMDTCFKVNSHSFHCNLSSMYAKVETKEFCNCMNGQRIFYEACTKMRLATKYYRISIRRVSCYTLTGRCSFSPRSIVQRWMRVGRLPEKRFFRMLVPRVTSGTWAGPKKFLEKLCGPLYLKSWTDSCWIGIFEKAGHRKLVLCIPAPCCFIRWNHFHQ